MKRIKRVAAIMTSIFLLAIISINIPRWLSDPAMNTDVDNEGINIQQVEEPLKKPPTVEAEIDAPNKKMEAPEVSINPNMMPIEDQPLETIVEQEPSWAGEVGQLLDGVSGIDEEWVLKKVEEHQDEIEQEDLEIGLAILDKIDANYLYEMSDGGFTEDEKIAAENFLYAELSEQDIQTLLSLIDKYSELID
ncbi:hypothetical protein JR334_07030 [Clostridia bacterium]|nr:hypothetical protein JR334_07030 [Clostridia bacterium]